MNFGVFKPLANICLEFVRRERLLEARATERSFENSLLAFLEHKPRHLCFLDQDLALTPIRRGIVTRASKPGADYNARIETFEVLKRRGHVWYFRGMRSGLVVSCRAMARCDFALIMGPNGLQPKEHSHEHCDVNVSDQAYGQEDWY